MGQCTQGKRAALGAFLRRLLTSRFLPAGLAITAVALTLPSLSAGWLMDDYIHQGIILGTGRLSELSTSRLDIFRFMDGDPQRTAKIMDLGVAPWWTFEGIKGSFWRPLTALTHWLDYQLWPGSAALMHAHSLLWFGLVVLAVAYLYRRFMGATWIAGLAALLYTLDDAHAVPVAFLANRSTLLATLFGVLALLAHDRWRREHRRGGAFVGPVLLAVSLLCKEAGIATFAYLVAYSAFLDRATWRARCLVLIPYGAVIVIWRIIWVHLGYGVSGLGLYVDPLVEPLRFAGAVIWRAPLLLLGQWALPPAETNMILSPAALRWLWVGAIAFCVWLTIVLVPVLRRDRLARFWGLGMLFSVIPVCATVPWDRLLFFVGIGAMGLLARLFAVVLGKCDWRPKRLLWRTTAAVLAVVFVIVHLIIAPIALPVRASHPFGSRESFEGSFVRTAFDHTIENQDLIVVNPPAALPVGFLPIFRDLSGQPSPRHVRVLATAPFCPVSIHRPDAHTLLIRPQDGYLSFLWDRLFRNDLHPLSLGQRVELSGMTAQVTALTADGRPAEVAFHFTVPLEDTSLRWLQFRQGEFVPFTPPPVSQTVQLPAAMSSY